MLNIKYIRENIEEVKAKLKERGFEGDIDSLIEKYREKNTLLERKEALQKRRNDISKEIGMLKRDRQDASLKLKEASDIAEELEKIDIDDKEREIKEFLLSIPNLCDEDVPKGKTEDDNLEVKKVGEPLIKDGLTHEELLKSIGFENERAVKISGSRFVILKGKLAELERGLAALMLREHKKRGYIEHSLPLLVKEHSMLNSGQFPKFREDAYSSDDNLFLIPTSEVALVNMLSGECLDGEYKATAYTPCFRRESGSYGKDTKGLIRLHQFNKVELVKFVKPENSNNALESLLLDAENILKLLDLPYRVVLKCIGDTGFTAVKTYDIEVWMPSQGKYREISSCSNTKDFQSRRGSIKIDVDGKREYAHILNGSGVAVGRALAALVENNQKDGKVDLDDLLKRVKAL